MHNTYNFVFSLLFNVSNEGSMLDFITVLQISLPLTQQQSFGTVAYFSINFP